MAGRWTYGLFGVWLLATVEHVGPWGTWALGALRSLGYLLKLEPFGAGENLGHSGQIAWLPTKN